MIEDNRIISCSNVYTFLKNLYLYEELDYIESNGSQYIDTEYFPNSETRVILDIESDTNIGETHVFGSRTSTGSSDYYLMLIDSGLRWRSDYYNSKQTLASAPRSGKIHIDKNKNVTTINNTYTVRSTYTSFHNNKYPLYIFAVNTGNSPSTFLKAKLLSCKIYDGNDLVRDYVPAKSPNGDVGLYDKIYKKFYSDSNNGNFIAGSHIDYLPYNPTEPSFKNKMAKIEYIAKLLNMNVISETVKNRPISFSNLKTIFDKATRCKLPKGYYPVEYIEGTGSQYIDTGYIPTGDTRVKTHFYVTSEHTNSQTFFGARQTGAGSNIFAVWGEISSKVLRWDYNKTATNLNGISYKNNWEIDFNKNDFKANSIQSSLSKATYTVSGKSLYIFALNQGTFNSDQIARMKLYYMKIYDNGNLVRDLIPAVRISDNVSGVYDRITENFYTNIGSGNFIVGPRIHILPNKPYTQLQYVEGTGQQWIDTGVIPNENTVIRIKFMGIEGTGDALVGFMTEPNNDDNKDYRLFNHQDDYLWYWDIQSSRLSGGQWKENTVHNVEAGNNYLKDLDTGQNILSGNKVGAFTTTYTIRLLKASDSAVYMVKSRIYSLEILQGSTSVRHYIPVKMNDGSIGLYDLVNSEFYGSQGPSAFVAGPKKNESKQYIQIQYITFLGQQYIDTGYKAGGKTRVVTDIYLSTQNPETPVCIFGSRDINGNTHSNCFNLFRMTSSSFRYDYRIDLTAFSHKATGRMIIDANKSIMYIDDTPVSSNAEATFTSSRNLLIGAMYSGSSYVDGIDTRRFIGDVYSFKVYDNDVLIRDFIPVKTLENQIGLWDLVEDKFYGNAGTGAFVAGPEI